jgi:hypothetical protein
MHVAQVLSLLPGLCRAFIYMETESLKVNEVIDNEDKMAGECSSHRRGEKRIRRREDNIRLDLREIGWEGVDWIQLAQNRDQWWGILNTEMNLRVP